MWEDDREYERQERKNLALLKKQGWKESKNDYGITMVKHPEYGMMTLERAMKGDYGDV